MGQHNKFISVDIACKDNLEAERLGCALVEQKLAACVQLRSVRSFYCWQGTLEKDDEVLLTLKTTGTCFEPLRQFVRTHHSYDTPQITATPIIDLDPDYASWLVKNTSA